MILNIDKNIMPNKNITYFLNPDYIYIPAKNIYVKEKEYVYKFGLVADCNLSSVSGKVLGIKKCNVMSNKTNTVVIQNDYREYFKDNQSKLKIKFRIYLNYLKMIKYCLINLKVVNLLIIL